jgi:hypothetical protein
LDREKPVSQKLCVGFQRGNSEERRETRENCVKSGASRESNSGLLGERASSPPLSHDFDCVLVSFFILFEPGVFDGDEDGRRTCPRLATEPWLS